MVCSPMLSVELFLSARAEAHVGLKVCCFVFTNETLD